MLPNLIDLEHKNMREIKFRAWDKAEKMMRKVWDDLAHIDGLELMQFTGLLDKSGKEIYEGDVLKCRNHLDTLSYGYAPGPSTENTFGYYWTTSGSALATVDDVEDRYEVIGNIYEHSELLKP